jgi:hypothetical protein
VVLPIGRPHLIDILEKIAYILEHRADNTLREPGVALPGWETAIGQALLVVLHHEKSYNYSLAVFIIESII